MTYLTICIRIFFLPKKMRHFIKGIYILSLHHLKSILLKYALLREHRFQYLVYWNRYSQLALFLEEMLWVRK